MKKTADGSFTLKSQQYDEHYHSVKDGALRESLYKHAKPALAQIDLMDEIKIMDICFGLGYNTLATLFELDLMGYSGKVVIKSPELDLALLDSLRFLQYPKELIYYLDLIHEISLGKNIYRDNLTIEIYRGNAVDFVKNLDEQFDIIYQDPFSSSKNSELWSEEFFIDLFKVLKTNGILTTYSQAKQVRHTMKSAGFLLYEHSKMPIRSGTIASKAPLKGLRCLQD